ncbi:MAG: 16S rRNA (guanine(966)-N(2))-methyltransferase RsmD [Acidobacteria bacterium]|nr:MAG: 16S rRNA (guanine(966)-N(2))-methyltransferase RsmD [Acidobacteriota bacterium]PYS08644.1 MAG: 16S rRNA (guanine(966)-N(2))-methyltransferase RsmD [Acidobacteriota bacterium]
MRIISGKFKSRRLKGTPPMGVRPTSDKLRETLFNVLGARVQGAVFLDGCAGAGAIGIEAISRGAEFVYFVEQSRKACQIVRENLNALEIQEGFKVMEMDLMTALHVLDTRFDIAFIDPPYDREDLYERVLDAFGSAPCLAAEGLLILEHSKRNMLPEASGKLRKIRSLVQGDAALAFYSSLEDA